MSLAEPAIAYRKGQALPPGKPRTLIVLGAARGGTTMVAQMLHDLGVFMGERLDATCQDAAMNEISRALFDDRIGIDHPAIEQVLRARDRQFAVWGWKFPTRIFPALYAKARHPHVIAVFRDPVAIATRESVSHGYAVEPCLARALAQIADLGRFVGATAYPCLGVSYERGLARKAALVDELVEFAGIAATPGLRQVAAEQARPATPQYLRDTRPADIEGMLDCVDRQLGGWLRYPHEVGRKVAFAILIDDAPVYQGVADRFRPDLQKEFGNDGCCSFAVPTPRRVMDGRRHKVTIRIADNRSQAIGNNDVYWTIAEG